MHPLNFILICHDRHSQLLRCWKEECIRKITWLKLLTGFDSCCFNSWTLAQEVPYTAAKPPTLERSVEIQASQNLSKSQSRLWISKLRVQDEDMVMNEGQGKSCWMGDKQKSVITFVQGQQGAQQKPLETSLTFPASFTVLQAWHPAQYLTILE